MRLMMKVSLPVETANDMAMDGMLGKKIKEILELNSTLKCNSGYFKKYFTRSTVIQTLSWSVV